MDQTYRDMCRDAGVDPNTAEGRQMASSIEEGRHLQAAEEAEATEASWPPEYHEADRYLRAARGEMYSTGGDPVPDLLNAVLVLLGPRCPALAPVAGALLLRYVLATERERLAEVADAEQAEVTP